MLVVGGLIVGNPGDTRESIEANLAFARQYVDWPYIQHPTPYPGTPMTKDFREKNLIVNEDVDEYDGTTAVVRTEYAGRRRDRVHALARRTLDESAAFPGRAACTIRVRRPLNARRMMRHTFRGSTLRTLLGLEDEREAFRRYKAIRRKEREFFPEDRGTNRCSRRSASRRLNPEPEPGTLNHEPGTARRLLAARRVFCHSPST